MVDIEQYQDLSHCNEEEIQENNKTDLLFNEYCYNIKYKNTGKLMTGYKWEG